MPRVVRLVTLADVDARRVSVSARHEAVLEDGRRVLLLDDRGWSQTLAGADARVGPELLRILYGEVVVDGVERLRRPAPTPS